MDAQLEGNETLGTALPWQMAAYVTRSCPRTSRSVRLVPFALALIRKALDDAAKAMIEGDVVAMIRAHEALKGFEL